MQKFIIKRAQRDDIPEIENVMNLSIIHLQKGFLTDKQIQASRQGMGLDTQLIDDGTYFCVYTMQNNDADSPLNLTKAQAENLAKGLAKNPVNDPVKSGSKKQLVGCGGWSMRATLYGGNHSKGRNIAVLDPKTDAARIRAMYTHPDWTRRGIGRLIIDHCEAKIIQAGFKRAVMMATLSGQPLYQKCGYCKIETHEDIAQDGTIVPLVRMGKTLIDPTS